MISVFLLTGRLVSFRKKVMTIKTPVSWMGNKTSILHIIYALFPKSYTRYIEPFGGSGAVLLGKSVPDKFEVYNDYNANLVNLFRCMRDRPMEFIRELGFLNLNSRDDFTVIKRFFQKEEFGEKYLEQQLELTNIMLPELQAKELCELYRQSKGDYDLKRAVMFLKLVRYSYSSGGKSFACQPFNVAALFILIEQLGKRLANAVIENQDFEVLIKHYDRPDSFSIAIRPTIPVSMCTNAASHGKIMCGCFGCCLNAKVNGWCHTMTARKYGSCTGTTISSHLHGFILWYRNMKPARNSPNC